MAATSPNRVIIKFDSFLKIISEKFLRVILTWVILHANPQPPAGYKNIWFVVSPGLNAWNRVQGGGTLPLTGTIWSKSCG